MVVTERMKAVLDSICTRHEMTRREFFNLTTKYYEVIIRIMQASGVQLSMSPPSDPEGINKEYHVSPVSRILSLKLLRNS